ncbi:MAG: spore protease YyaC [Clostridia bacterium]|nr:spore protease YyaC [Clostridia bacterium]
MVSVDIKDEKCIEKLECKLKSLLKDKKVVVLCIGSDKVVGDSLGPSVGTMLLDGLNSDVIVYGTLQTNVNAKNLLLVKEMIKVLHPDRTLLCIDAALGVASEVGTIQIYNHGLYPGSATNKNLPCVGDLSIVGVVNQKMCAFELSMLYTAKFNLINQMAQTICNTILSCVNQK